MFKNCNEGSFEIPKPMRSSLFLDKLTQNLKCPDFIPDLLYFQQCHMVL